MSLLDFAMDFGAGFTGVLAQERAAEAAAQRKSRLEEQRQANLMAMKAQYKQEETAEAEERRRAAATSGDTSELFALTGDPRFVLEQGSPEATAALRTREAKISDAMGLYDLDRADAVRMVDGHTQFRVDELGNVVQVDLPTRTARAVDVQREEPPARRPTPPPTDVEDLAFDVGVGTGALAASKGLWNSTLGQVNFLPVFEGPETAAQMLTVIQRDAVRALAISGRPPVMEQERIVAMVPQPMDWLQNPKIAELQLAAFVDVMGLQYRSDLDAIDDPSVSASEKQFLRTRIRQVEHIVDRIITPEASEKFFNYSPKKEESEIQQLTSSLSSLFAAQYNAGTIPEIPSVLISPDMTESSFNKLLDDLGISKGQPFFMPNYGARIRQ
jgi:hypothetical protein